MKIRVFITVVILSSCYSGFGQKGNDKQPKDTTTTVITTTTSAMNGSTIQNIIPASPNAYGFAKYGEIPVSLYSGIPDISIPIGSIREKNIELNVSLSYHGSGIKVDEIASWTGLGWSLNAGGMITRTIRDKPEEPLSTGGLYPERIDLGFPEPYYADGTFSDLNIFYRADKNYVDIEPDIYYFNFAGRSGKFLFNNSGVACFDKYSDLKVQYLVNTASQGNLSKFIITTETGIIYEFAYCDYTYSSSLGRMVVTGWYLSKIETPTGDVITLEYADQLSRHMIYEDNKELVGESKHIFGLYYPPVLSNDNSYEVVLKKIKTSNSGWIEFKTSSDTRDARKDYYYRSYPLEEIIFYNVDNIPVRRVKFYTSYFLAPSFASDQFPGYSSYISFEHLRYRLKLDSLRFYSEDGQNFIPSYKFNYYNDLNAGLYNLPFRLSSNQDHWGYFNNANNKTLIPSVNWTVTAGFWMNIFMNMSPDEDYPYSASGFTGGANREADAEAAKACTLYKIIYPTRGYTIFNFESHIFDNNSTGGGLRIKAITDYNHDGVKVREKNYFYKPFRPEKNPPFENYSSGFLIEDPRKYYVIAGRAELETNGLNVRPDNPLGDLLGSPSDWERIYFGNTGYVYKISALPQAVLGLTSGQSVGYSSVTEYEPGNGYSVYEFSSPGDFPDFYDPEELFDPGLPQDIFQSQYSTIIKDGGWGGWKNLMQRRNVACNQLPFLHHYDNDWKRGLPLSTNIYTENRINILSEENEYHLVNSQNIPGYKVFSLSYADAVEYIHGKYYIPVNWVALKKQTRIQYDKNGLNPIKSVSENYFGSNVHKFITKAKTYNSKGDSLITRNYYPQDFNSVQNFSTLVGAHIIDLPVDTRTYVNRQLVSGEQVKYNNFGQPTDLYKAEIASGVTDIPFDPGNPYKFTHKLNYQYDDKKNIKQVIPDDNLNTTYLWSYNSTYPVAKIDNATYSQVSSAIGITLINSLAAAAIQSAIDSYLLQVRNSLSNALPGAFVTTYTYKPLTGIISETDPAGRTTYYDYDGFGRLKLIRDQENSILKKYDYHYSNQ